jgi:hypothetical protein
MSMGGHGLRGGVSKLLIAAGMAGCVWGCAELVLPVRPGSPFMEKPGNGLVFGRIAVIRDGEDQLSAIPSFRKEFGWVLTQLKSGKKYVTSPLTQHGMFVLDLPAGSYEVSKLMYEERDGFWEGHLLARFTVQPDKLTYLGTWELQFMNLGPSSPIGGKVLDQQDEASDDLTQTYTGLSRPIAKGLLVSAKEGSLSLLRPRFYQ